MAFHYEWKDSIGGSCCVEVIFNYEGTIEVDISSLREEFDKLQQAVNEWDSNKYSEEELNDFESKLNLLNEFIRRN